MKSRLRHLREMDKAGTFERGVPVRVGSAQRLANGKTLLCWGMVLLATVHSQAGAVVWEDAS